MFQADLLQVLSDFRVRTADDYYKLPPGNKTYFIRRLYAAFADNEHEAFRDLSTAGGVKFHFATSGDLSFDANNLPNMTFLKKLCFYSNRTLITFPFKELRNAAGSRAMKNTPRHEWRRSKIRENSPILFGKVVVTNVRNEVRDDVFVGLLNDRGYYIDPAAFRDFLEIVTSLKPAIDADLTYLLPAFPDKKADLRRISRKLIRANFTLPELKRQFLEEDLVERSGFRFEGDLLNLYLPYFTKIPLERVLEIRDHQQDMYNAFQRYLQNLLAGFSQEDTETKLLSTLRDIDTGIRELDKKFQSVRTDYRRKDIFMGIGVLSTGLALIAGIEWGKDLAQTIASVTGAATGMQFFSAFGEKKKAMGSIAEDRFYVPWLMKREASSLAEQSDQS